MLPKLAKPYVRKVVFEPAPQDDFTALYAAEKWCRENGFSVGRHQAHAPCGLMRGDFDIQKWRNLRKDDIAALDGILLYQRGGPAVLHLAA